MGIYVGRLIRWIMAAGLMSALGGRIEAAPPPDGKLAQRWILVMFGTDPVESGGRKLWGPDSMAAAFLQMPLEWLGYEVEYRSITEPLPALPLPEKYAGVITDSTLEVPHDKEDAFMQWLGALVKTRVKTLLTGNVAMGGQSSRQGLMDALHLQGNADTLNYPRNSRILKKDERIMHGETPLAPSKLILCNITAPPDAEVYLSLEAEDERGSLKHFDAVFRTPWGGALFDPYVAKQYSPNHLYELFDPFALMEAIFGHPDLPVPDPTTRDGCRVFFSHIDGDGFNSISNVTPHAMNAEVIRDQVLKKYPFPVTVSVIEATMRGLEMGDDGNTEDYARVARDIFAMPKVDAASHSFSHPFVWIPNDNDSIRLNRAPVNLTLKPTANYPVIDPVREVTGSLDYINKNLLPPGHRTVLFLWPGNCRPPPEALAAVHNAGVLDMNGGTTIMSKRWPGLGGVAPRTAMMDGELQVYAAAQNEMFYTDDWKAKYMGGFGNVVETFELTGHPRRLKPVNIYYHFYSGERGDALNALIKAEDWALNQPLHSIRATQWVLSVLDARQCTIRKVGEGHWTIESKGDNRTYRLPLSDRFPRVGLDTGVTGWTDDLGCRYVHTTDTKTPEIELIDHLPEGPSLISSSGETKFSQLDAQGLAVEVADLRPVHLSLRLPSTESWQIEVDGRPAKALPKDGVVELTTPAMAKVVVFKRSP